MIVTVILPILAILAAIVSAPLFVLVLAKCIHMMYTGNLLRQVLGAFMFAMICVGYHSVFMFLVSSA